MDIGPRRLAEEQIVGILRESRKAGRRWPTCVPQTRDQQRSFPQMGGLEVSDAKRADLVKMNGAFIS
jgi:hypothetical protein